MLDGRVCSGSAEAGGATEFDNLYINGFRTYYQPITVAP
jgi:hypothetical protein